MEAAGTNCVFYLTFFCVRMFTSLVHAHTEVKPHSVALVVYNREKGYLAIYNADKYELPHRVMIIKPKGRKATPATREGSTNDGNIDMGINHSEHDDNEILIMER